MFFLVALIFIGAMFQLQKATRTPELQYNEYNRASIKSENDFDVSQIKQSNFSEREFFCTKCGSKVYDADIFCLNCGNKVD